VLIFDLMVYYVEVRS